MGMAREEGGEGEGVRQPKRVGALSRALQSLAIDHGGQVEEGAVRRRHRYALGRRDLAGRKVRTVETHARARAMAGPGRDLGNGWHPTQQTPERCGGPMAEGGAATGSEHGGHPAPAPGEGPMADRVNAAMDRV